MTAITINNVPEAFLKNFGLKSNSFDFSEFQNFLINQKKNFSESKIFSKSEKNISKKSENIGINRLKGMSLEEVEKNFIDENGNSKWLEGEEAITFLQKISGDYES